jgi:hypothetical protein
VFNPAPPGRSWPTTAPLTGFVVSGESQRMYKVIGADGKEYGPVSAEVLRDWILQGRANGQTRVRPEGATEWKTLSELPDFGAALAAAATPKVITPPQPASVARTNPLATTGLVLGIVSITIGLCCCYGFPFNLAGIICSAIALAQINKDPSNQTGKGLAIAGLIISIMSLVLAGLIMVIGGIAMSIPDALERLRRL